jgi:feruloyl esterase
MVRSLLLQTAVGILLVSAALAASQPAPEPRSSFESNCLQFDPTSYVSNASVNALEFVAAGNTLQFPGNDPSCARPNQTVSVDICRVALNISTSDKSGIIFENWLPESWTGRFLATGNGGIDGCLKYEDVDYGVLNGFSSVGSNNGHNGTGGLAFFHNNEVLEDYVWRSYVSPLIICSEN